MNLIEFFENLNSINLLYKEVTNTVRRGEKHEEEVYKEYCDLGAQHWSSA